MKVVVALLLLTAGVPITVGTARWWWRRRRADDYRYVDRNIGLSLGGLGLLSVLASVQLLR